MTKDIFKIVEELDEYYEPIEKEVKDSVYYFIAEPKKDVSGNNQASSIKNDLVKELHLLKLLILISDKMIAEAHVDDSDPLVSSSSIFHEWTTNDREYIIKRLDLNNKSYIRRDILSWINNLLPEYKI